ncbi:hypothetical protein MMC30_004992 [Trapelia coarctata]|nr:hypothetical protein [Trapelia coarctata]
MAEEPIWEDHQLAELGRVWEQEVHGASLEYGASLSATAGILWAAKWPDFAAGVRYRKKTQVGKFKGLSTRYAVPMPYIHLVSSMEFRRKYRGSRNPKLVWFPKIYGINFESLRQNLTLGRYGDDDVIGRQAWDHQIPELEEWFRNWDRLRKEAVGDADRKAVLEGDDESISSLWPVHGEDLRAK